MKADPLFDYFRELRNEILKEGAPPTAAHMSIGYLDGAMMAELQPDAPPGTRNMFFGDRLGGSGFEVQMPDGSIEKYYVALPDHWDVTMRLQLPNPPLGADGQPRGDPSIESLCRAYVDALGVIVADARQAFG